MRESDARVVVGGRPADSTGRDEPRISPLRALVTTPNLAALLALSLAHMFDYTSFVVLVGRHGLAAEANPVVVRIAELAGLPGLTLAKIATVAFAALLIVFIAPHRRRLALALLFFGVAAGLVGGISNIASL